MSNHHIVRFRYLTILFVNYNSIKLGKQKNQMEILELKNIITDNKKLAGWAYLQNGKGRQKTTKS